MLLIRLGVPDRRWKNLQVLDGYAAWVRGSRAGRLVEAMYTTEEKVLTGSCLPWGFVHRQCLSDCMRQGTLSAGRQDGREAEWNWVDWAEERLVSCSSYACTPATGPSAEKSTSKLCSTPPWFHTRLNLPTASKKKVVQAPSAVQVDWVAGRGGGRRRGV
jgi:hypothetical protein